MEIELLGTAGPRGWPEPDCRCASCGRLRAAATAYEPTRVVVDGVPLDACSRTEVPGGYDALAPGSERILVAGGPGEHPDPVPGRAYDAVLLDLVDRPAHLGLLRRVGAVTPATRVLAVHVDHRMGGPDELDRRLGWWRAPHEGPRRLLLLGGARSGKSAEAELRLAGHPEVTYLAMGGRRDGDPEWAARIAAHRARRPSWWRTVEGTGLPHLLRATAGAVLVDAIGTWLTAAMDEAGAWTDPAAVGTRVDELVDAWRTTRAYVVAVSEEVGLSVVPATPVGRAFRDVLGRLNQRLAAESEESALVVAGRVLDLTAAGGSAPADLAPGAS